MIRHYDFYTCIKHEKVCYDEQEIKQHEDVSSEECMFTVGLFKYKRQRKKKYGWMAKSLIRKYQEENMKTLPPNSAILMGKLYE